MNTLEPWTTVRDAIGELPEPAEGSDVAEWDEPYDPDYYRDQFSGLYLPRSDFGRAMREPPQIPEPTGTAISVFSGCGGFDLGTTMAGFETRVFIENDKSAVQTLIHNAAAFGWLDAVIFDCDVRKIDASQVLFAGRLERGECDLVTGGFPCQPFSQSGKRKGRNDDRGNLFYELTRLIDGIQPKAFLLENVPGLLSSNAGDDIRAVCEELDRIGYWFFVAKLNAVNYGVPQDRQRIFFHGFRPDIADKRGRIAEVAPPTHGHPDTLLPSFQPIWLWKDGQLEQINEPAPGQVSGSVNAAQKHEKAKSANHEPTLFEGAA